MSTEYRVRQENGERYGNREIFMEHARRLRSQAVCEMIGRLIPRPGGVFGRLMAPFAKTMRPELPTIGKARPRGAAEVRLMRTNVSAS